MSINKVYLFHSRSKDLCESVYFTRIQKILHDSSIITLFLKIMMDCCL